MRTLIVADSTPAAESIRRSLRHAPRCHVIGYVNGRGPCREPVAGAQPDVVVVDDTRPAAQTLAAVRDVRAAAPDAKVVLLTDRTDAAWLGEAAAAGIDAAIARSLQGPAVGVLVRAVAAGEVFHPFAAPVPAEAGAPSNGMEKLTPRELEILRLVTAGASNSAIASAVWVTEQTVKFHLSNIYRKLGVGNRTQAAHYAHVHGLMAAGPPPAADAVTAAA